MLYLQEKTNDHDGKTGGAKEYLQMVWGLRMT